jgi:U32 family peptidase
MEAEYAEKIGRVEHYYPKVGAAAIRIERGELHLGDYVHIHGHGVDLVERVESLQRDHLPVREAHAGEIVGLAVPEKVRGKAEVYLLHGNQPDKYDVPIY